MYASMTRGSDCASAAVPSMSLLPWSSTTTRSVRAAMRPMWCSTMTTVMSSSPRRRRTVPISCSTSACGRPAAGSSSSSSRGFMSSARHSSTPLCRPCDSSSAGRCAAHPRPLRSSRSSASVRSSFSERRGGGGGGGPPQAVALQQVERLGAQLLLGAAGARQPQRPLQRSTREPGVRTEQHVLQDRRVQLQRGVLEGPGQAMLGERRRTLALHLGAVDPHGAAGRLVVPADAVEQGGLAGAVRPDEPEDLARLDGEAHLLQHLDAAKLQTHVLQGQLSRHWLPLPPLPRCFGCGPQPVEGTYESPRKLSTIW